MSMKLALMFFCMQVVVHGAPSTKKCVASSAVHFMCNDFKVLDNINCWHDWRCNFDYYHENNICSQHIHKYASNHVSMIWGVYAQTNYSCHLGTQTTAIQGANEPNHPNQSNRTAAEVAAIWPQIEANANGLPLVSPSAAPCGSGCAYNTTQWFDEFFDLCSDCNVTYLATHTYWCNATRVMNYLEMLYNRYNRKIWLTEFACRTGNNNATRVLEFMEEILPMLEAADYVEKYFWFMARIPNNNKWVKTSASLLKPTKSQLTTLGQYYNNYNPS